jgi:hypothetical protein
MEVGVVDRELGNRLQVRNHSMSTSNAHMAMEGRRQRRSRPTTVHRTLFLAVSTTNTAMAHPCQASIFYRA